MRRWLALYKWECGEERRRDRRLFIMESEYEEAVILREAARERVEKSQREAARERVEKFSDDLC